MGWVINERMRWDKAAKRNQHQKPDQITAEGEDKMEFTKIIVEKKDRIAKITMNRPEAVSWGRSLPPKSTAEASTLVTNRFEGLPDPPYVICCMRLDGTDTTIPHFLTGIDLSDAERAR